MNTSHGALLLALLMTAGHSAQSQSLTLADVLASGGKRLTAEEAKDVVTGAVVELKRVSGQQNRWTNDPDGKFVASRDILQYGKSRTARGTWSINDDGALCLVFDWGAAEVENWCRVLYRVGESYYAYNLGAGPETLSGRYRFSK